MITLNGYGRVTNRLVCSICGLSSDVKPTDKIEGISIENGSTFLEMDTGKAFIFDKENKKWYEI